MAVKGTINGRYRYYDWPLKVLRLAVANYGVIISNGDVIGRSFKVTVKWVMSP